MLSRGPDRPLAARPAGARDDRLRGLNAASDDLALGEDIAADLGDLDAAGRALDEPDARIRIYAFSQTELRKSGPFGAV